ncbi:epidermal differentiation-specific -like protein [Labeo rohita]|uniref:Epidermal differentiation-specific-like protein n=1 Tax=Labeo rohita TaxID=84645 RepID=A0A498P5G4_LABRO|nr:epidermal differentiation-specific -like protein [Labeo rohita]
MSKIVVFTEEGFRGRTAEFKNNVRNLEEKGFSDVISSLKVIGAPWVAYYDKNFAGKQRVFQEGEYATLDDKGMFSSLKIITDDLDNPEIQLFEDVLACKRRIKGGPGVITINHLHQERKTDCIQNCEKEHNISVTRY